MCIQYTIPIRVKVWKWKYMGELTKRLELDQNLETIHKDNTNPAQSFKVFGPTFLILFVWSLSLVIFVVSRFVKTSPPCIYIWLLIYPVLRCRREKKKNVHGVGFAI